MSPDNFVDGLSITTTREDAGASRNPVWTFAAGVSDNLAYDNKEGRCGCPCTDFGGPVNKAIVNPDGVATTGLHHLYCNAGYHGTTVPPHAWVTTDTLWDAVGALTPSTGGFDSCDALEQHIICDVSASNTNTPTPTPTATPTPTPTPSSSPSSPLVAVISGAEAGTGSERHPGSDVVVVEPAQSSSTYSGRGFGWLSGANGPLFGVAVGGLAVVIVAVVVRRRREVTRQRTAVQPIGFLTSVDNGGRKQDASLQVCVWAALAG